MGQEKPNPPESMWAYVVDRFHECDAAGDYEKAQAIALEMFDVAPKKQGEILYYLGLTWWRNGEVDLAEDHFNHAFELISPQEDPHRLNPLLAIRLFNELSLLNQCRGAWIGPHGNLIGWVGLLEKRKRLQTNMFLYRASRDSRDSIGVWEGLVDSGLKKKPGFQNHYLHALDVQGLAYTASGTFCSAKENHLKIIEEATKIGDQPAVMCARNNLGLVYYFEARQRPKNRQELLAKAEECFCWRVENDPDKTSVGYAIVLSNLARVLEAQGKENESWDIYHKCLTLAIKTGQEILARDCQRRINHQILNPTKRSGWY